MTKVEGISVEDLVQSIQVLDQTERAGERKKRHVVTTVEIGKTTWEVSYAFNRRKDDGQSDAFFGLTALRGEGFKGGHNTRIEMISILLDGAGKDARIQQAIIVGKSEGERAKILVEVEDEVMTPDPSYIQQLHIGPMGEEKIYNLSTVDDRLTVVGEPVIITRPLQQIVDRFTLQAQEVITAGTAALTGNIEPTV